MRRQQVGETLKIFGRTFSVRVVPKGQVPKGADGAMLEGVQELYANGDQVPAQIGDTVLHEVIHVVEKLLGAGLEERQVHALSCGLHAVLRDNPGLVGLWCRGEGEGMPPRVRVLGKEMRVEQRLQVQIGGMGSTNLETDVIEVAADLHAEAQRSALLYSVLSAVVDSLCLGLDRHQLTLLEVGLYAAFVGNAAFWEDLLLWDEVPA